MNAYERRRAKYDTDDRRPCICKADHDTAYRHATPQRCLNRTRHPSGLCADCSTR